MDSLPEKSGDGWYRTKHRVTELHACQIESLFLRFASCPFISITGGSPYRRKNSVNCVGTLRFRSGKKSFGFKKLLELVWTLTCLRLSSIDEVDSFTPLQASQFRAGLFRKSD